MNTSALHSSSRLKRWAVNLSLAVISVIVFLVIAEVVLRIFDPNLYYKSQYFPQNRDIDFPEFYKKDSQLFWRFRPDTHIDSRQFSTLTYDINSRGLRGPEIEPTDTKTRVLALGNSCTFGWGIPYRDIFTSVLQQQLNASAGGDFYQVINAGIPGYSSFQGKRFLPQLMDLHPSAVLIMFGWNDHFPAGHKIRDSQQRVPPGVILSLQNLLSRLKLYQFMRKTLLSVTEDRQELRLDDISLTRRVTRQEMGENLREMIQFTRNQGAMPILLIPPVASVDIYFHGGNSPFHKLHQSYQNEIRKIAVLSNTRLIDLQAVFDEHNDLYDDAAADPIHFNALGHEVAATTLADSLSLWLPHK